MWLPLFSASEAPKSGWKRQRVTEFRSSPVPIFQASNNTIPCTPLFNGFMLDGRHDAYPQLDLSIHISRKLIENYT